MSDLEGGGYQADSLVPHALLMMEEIRHSFYQQPLMVRVKFGIDRQRDNFARRSLGFRKITFFVTQIGKCPLKMKRMRIVDFGGQTIFRQVSTEPVAIRG